MHIKYFCFFQLCSVHVLVGKVHSYYYADLIIVCLADSELGLSIDLGVVSAHI